MAGESSPAYPRSGYISLTRWVVQRKILLVCTYRMLLFWTSFVSERPVRGGQGEDAMHVKG
jgi:hypothetical protein